MAFGFAKQSGGHLAVYSELGLGTTFRLYLPRGTRGCEVPSMPSPAGAVIGGHENVLVVEDNAQLRYAAVRQFTDLGYRVREAVHATAAMAILAGGEDLDLLFTDVVMPGSMDGLELAYQATQMNPNLRVLLVSGFPGMRGGEHRTVASPFPLLNKPYTRDQLARAVRAVLDKPGNATIEDVPAIAHAGEAERPRQ
jgi:CheY-like chemotaxis protein